MRTTPLVNRDAELETGARPSSRPIWEAEVLQYRQTFVSAALGGDGAVGTFARNERGRDFVVGDIHGMYSALERFLEELSFKPGRDRLFSVGDLIDRGPESEAALQWLTGREWFHAIRGNHDQFLLDAAADPAGERGEEHGVWDYNGGGWWNAVPASARDAWVRAFSALPLAAEVDCEMGTVGIVHADVPEDRTWEEFLSALRDGSREDSYHAIWSRRRMERYLHRGSAEAAPAVEGRVACVICGHARGDRAERLANLWMIDTGAAYTRAMPGSRFTIARVHPGPIRLFEHPTQPDPDSGASFRRFPG